MSIYVVLAIILINMTAYKGSKVVVALFAVNLGIPQFFIGMMVALYSVFPVLLGLYAGKLTDRLGVRVPMIGGTLGVSAALLVPFALPGTPALFASAALIGATWVFYNICAQNLIGILSDTESRARNFANFGLVMACGSFCGPLVAGFSIDHFSLRQTYLHLALLPFISAMILIAFRALPKGLGKGKVSEEHATTSANLLSNKPLRRTLITGAIVLTGTDLFQFYMPIYGASIGLSASAIGMVLAMFAVAAFIVRLGMPNVVKRFGPDTVLVWSMFIGAVAYLVFPAFNQAVLLGAVAFVLGLGMGCGQPLSLMLIYERAPPGRSAEALGMRLTINNSMHIAIPLLFGAIGSLFGSPAVVFAANAGVMVVGGTLSRKVQDTRLREAT